jgi:hypothetical protein
MNLIGRITVRSSTTAIGRGLKLFDVRTDPPNQINVKAKKNN